MAFLCYIHCLPVLFPDTVIERSDGLKQLLRIKPHGAHGAAFSAINTIPGPGPANLIFQKGKNRSIGSENRLIKVKHRPAL
jgi:hypothetical protein